MELRGFPPAEIEAMKKQMGDKLVVAEPRINLSWGVAFNVTKKPFDDVRVRQAVLGDSEQIGSEELLGDTIHEPRVAFSWQALQPVRDPFIDSHWTERLLPGRRCLDIEVSC